MPIDPHLWGADAPAFAERVMRLAGQTTYRMPAAGGLGRYTPAAAGVA